MVEMSHEPAALMEVHDVDNKDHTLIMKLELTDGGRHPMELDKCSTKVTYPDEYIYVMDAVAISTHDLSSALGAKVRER